RTREGADADQAALRLDPGRYAAVARVADYQCTRRRRRGDRAGPVRVPLAARPGPAGEHARDDPREPESQCSDPGHPSDHVRWADAALARSDRDPAGELRSPVLQDAAQEHAPPP